jgi:hypothetical protein
VGIWLNSCIAIGQHITTGDSTGIFSIRKIPLQNDLIAQNRANAAVLDDDVHQEYWPNLEYCAEVSEAEDKWLKGRIVFCHCAIIRLNINAGE